MALGDAGRPPVVLLHGWGGSYEASWVRHGWRDRLNAAGRQVIGIDLLGHGAKPAIEDPEHYADIASAVEAELPDGPLDIVGFSLGAKISLELASRRSDRFRRMVLGGLGDGFFVAGDGVGLAQALEQGLTAEDRVIRAGLLSYMAEANISHRGLAAVLRRPPNPIADIQALGRIQSRILMVNGVNDPIASPDDKLRAAVGNPGYVRLANVDHYSMPAQASFLETAVQFLNEDP